MNLRNRIAEIRSKKEVDFLVNEIEHEPKIIKDLILLLEERKLRQSLYGSWVLCHVAENCPELISPFAKDILSLFHNSPHTGANRNLMRCFMEIDVPEDLMSPLIDQCLKFIDDPNQPVAVKAFSIESFSRIVVKMPDLANELRMAVSNIHLINSPALHSTMKKTRLMMKKNGIPF